ncbi:MAG: DUF1992 domain-containing protein [Halobacteriovoraceae bacterium]|jgi:hypothetical protein|nr:DUF1992 domain-containing protein [Halobacteriovoraceae bacterium]MBT5094262.1 DUF1992 domain-containing protein [Halobacteriovoraceae bacterium]
MEDKRQSIIEEAIAKAVREGQFEKLPGAGKPLPPDAFKDAPEELKAGWRILKNAGFVPAEVELKQKIGNFREALQSPDLSLEQRKKLIKKIQLAEVELNIKMESYRR